MFSSFSPISMCILSYKSMLFSLKNRSWLLDANSPSPDVYCALFVIPEIHGTYPVFNNVNKYTAQNADF